MYNHSSKYFQYKSSNTNIIIIEKKVIVGFKVLSNEIKYILYFYFE